MSSSVDYDALTLKWGTLKGWSLKNESPRCIKLIKKYHDQPVMEGVMMQNDTPEQKKIICELIDEVKGRIFLDWDNKHVTKEEAKKYVLEYGKKS